MRTNLAYAHVADPGDGVGAIVSRNLDAAIERGDAMKVAMLQEEGGTLGVAEFAAATGLPLMDLLDLILAGKVIQVQPASTLQGVFPAFQACDGRLLPGLPEVVEAIDTSSSWGKLNFMLTPDRRLGGARPLDALRAGDIEGAVRAAKGYMTAGS